MKDYVFPWEKVDFVLPIRSVEGAGNLVFYPSVDQATSGIDVELTVRPDGTYEIRERGK